jgi:hypothetical protein
MTTSTVTSGRGKFRSAGFLDGFKARPPHRLYRTTQKMREL